jgi:hypothetical protein
MNAIVRARTAATAVLAFHAVLVTGCAQFVEAGPPPADPAGQFAPLTKPIILLGDTQEHEATGFPLHDNDGAVDAYVEVAQRPPEQPLFGRRILEWVLVNHPQEPVVHLGDVLDMSCKSELERMQALALSARQEGAILPGNHDGLMFGIFNHKFVGRLLEASGQAWYRGCLRGATEAASAAPVSDNPHDAVVTKRDFILAYLALFGTRSEDRIQIPRTSAAGDARISWKNPRSGAFIEAVEVRLHEEDAYANSFIAQKMRLPAASGASRGVVMIGLDTNQVSAVVGSLDAVRGISPGDIGHVRADQLAAIRPWLEDARRANDIVVFAGHHNWNRLSFASQARIATVMRGIDHPLVYISAHTHRGFWASHQLGQRSLLELNVSSLSDWPIAYRRVTFALDESAGRLKVNAEIMPNVGVRVGSDRQLLDAWESLTCDPTRFAPSRLEGQERLVVQRQRDNRGSLLEWLYEGLGENCASCQQTLYESGLRYQDAMLETILTLYHDFWTQVPEVAVLGDASVCGTHALPVCVGRLRAEDHSTLEQTIDLFKRRARLVDTANAQLDRIENPRVRSYMACRAVIAAQVDYELTPEDKRHGRGEDRRREQQFFRIEATVGMR